MGHNQETARSPGMLLPRGTMTESNSAVVPSKNFKKGFLNVLPLRNDQCLRRVICLMWFEHYVM